MVHDPNLVMPALKQLYKSPKDIDIYIGGLLERPPTRVGRFGQRRQRNGRRGRFWGGGRFRGLGVGRRRSKSGFIFETWLWTHTLTNVTLTHTLLGSG